MILISYVGLGTKVIKNKNDEKNNYSTQEDIIENKEKNKDEYVYNIAKYSFENQTEETDYFVLMLNKILRPEKTFLIFTAESKKYHYDKLKEKMDFE
jgi:hypothetical protein